MPSAAVFLITQNRSRLLRLTAPFLARAMRRVRVPLIVIDDASTDSKTMELVRGLHPHSIDVAPNGGRGVWKQCARPAEIAVEMGLRKFVSLDDDVLVGKHAVQNALDAVVTPQYPVCCFLAHNKLTTPADADGYYQESRKFSFLDCFRTVCVAGPIAESRGQVLKEGPRHVAGVAGSKLRLARPQVECQHLGYGWGASARHDPTKHGSWWVHHPCRDIDTGCVVSVRGFSIEKFSKLPREASVEDACRAVLCQNDAE